MHVGMYCTMNEEYVCPIDPAGNIIGLLQELLSLVDIIVFSFCLIFMYN